MVRHAQIKIGAEKRKRLTCLLVVFYILGDCAGIEPITNRLDESIMK